MIYSTVATNTEQFIIKGFAIFVNETLIQRGAGK
jgi:hypothetical protein